jgi:hypothetical protein
LKDELQQENFDFQLWQGVVNIQNLDLNEVVCTLLRKVLTTQGFEQKIEFSTLSYSESKDWKPSNGRPLEESEHRECESCGSRYYCHNSSRPW